MNPDHDRIEAIFTAALAKPAEERAAYLNQACGGDAELRQRLEALLQAHDNAGSFLAHPAMEAATSEDVSPARWIDPVDLPRPGEGPGSRIGPYKLLQQIGEGGMGIVFMAEQEQQVRRKVALKIIKPGMDSTQVIARFEAERQALALMDHQNIARVLDAGTTQSGRPYFVMELVKGVPITKFCDEAKLGIRQRLEIFTPICQAVQHAHQKGIIHRDLKPSNILITLIDGKPIPKVIDFGLAKATAGRLTDESLSTQLGAVIGTLEYMSPEQAGISREDIDTRADIYSMGVILYELLTGLRPLDVKRLRNASFTEVIRMIKEDEPTKPSTRLSTDESALSQAALRQIEPRKLAALLRGELDWVVMKCLEKDRSRRYETANGLARDIQRYLADDVVEARPPSAAYRLRKFVRRNRAFVSAGSALAAALLIGVIAFAWQAQIANRQRRIAQENEQRANANFLMATRAVDDYLTRVSENTLLKVQPSRDLRELRKGLLEDALKFYRSFIDQRQDDPSLRRELARAYARMAKITGEIGSRPDAMAGYSRAIEIQRALANAEPGNPTLRVDEAEMLIEVGSLHKSMGRSDWAIAAWEEARGVLDEVVHSSLDSREAMLQLAKSGSRLGAIYTDSEQWDRARPLYLRSNEILKRLVEIDPAEPKSLRDLAWSTYQIGNLLSHPRRKDPDFAEAKAHYDKALSLQRRLIAEHPGEPDYPMDMAQCYVSLASLAGRADQDFSGAVRYLEQALDLQKKVVATHSTVTLYLLDLSSTYYKLAWNCSRLPGRPNVAKWYRESITIAESLVELDPENVDFQDQLGRAVNNLGFILSTQGETDLAIREYLRAIDIHQRVLATGSDLPRHRSPMVVALENLARARVTQGKLAEALPSYEAALADTNPGVTEYQSDLATIYNDIGRLYTQRKQFAHAFAALDTGLAIRQKLADAHPTNKLYTNGLALSHAYRGGARIGAGQPAAAELRLAVELWTKDKTPDSETCFGRARAMALLAGLGADATSGVTAAEAATFADQAVTALRDAIQAGWAQRDEPKEPDFDPLRQRKDFKKLMAELEKPSSTKPEK
jgi:serine/threonine protein kinase